MQRTRVLVTGGAGYLGSVLSRVLDQDGFNVIALDNNLTSAGVARSPSIRYVTADVRQVDNWQTLLSEVDAVVHLAAIVGDPACDLDHELAWDTNYLATVALTNACREYGVERFIFASTCSNYGQSPGRPADTHAPLSPQSVYAETKVRAEHHVLSSAGPGFAPLILRLATLYGPSPRMRFDLAVNSMTAMAVRQHIVEVHGGTQWRPFLHIRDAAAAFSRTLRLPAGPSPSFIYNCGSDSENYRLIEVGKIIADEVAGTRLTVRHADTDERDYRVDFTATRAELKFEPEHTLRDGIREIVDAVSSGAFADVDDPAYSNYELVLSAIGDAARERSAVLTAGTSA